MENPSQKIEHTIQVTDCCCSTIACLVAWVEGYSRCSKSPPLVVLLIGSDLRAFKFKRERKGKELKSKTSRISPFSVTYPLTISGTKSTYIRPWAPSPASRFSLSSIGTAYCLVQTFRWAPVAMAVWYRYHVKYRNNKTSSWMLDYGVWWGSGCWDGWGLGGLVGAWFVQCSGLDYTYTCRPHGVLCPK